MYKAPIPTAALASRLGSYVQAYTLYSSVRPFGVTAIVGGWDWEAELPVDGQVGSGPSVGSGGKVKGAKAGGPGLYMIEPSGLYWVFMVDLWRFKYRFLIWQYRATMARPPVKADRPPNRSWKSSISLPATSLSKRE